MLDCGDYKIKITLVEAQNGHARIGFDAPQFVRINRGDVKTDEQGKPTHV